MKRLLLTFSLVLFTIVSSVAQCPNDNTLHTTFDASTLAVAAPATTMTSAIWGGEYVEVTNMLAANTYTIAMCGSPSNTQLTVYSSSGGASLGTSDDVCADDASITFTPPSDGSYRFLSDTGPSCGSAIGNNTMTIRLDMSSLPVELGEFYAGLHEISDVRLTWETFSELNNEGFIITHSMDGHVWEELGVVEGSGNSSSRIEYSFIHRDPGVGIHYYKLVQRDFDGTEKSSDVRTVEVGIDGNSALQLLPNPSSGENVYVQIKTDIQTVNVLDNYGRNLNVEYNQSSGMLIASGLPAGLYYVVVTNSKGEHFTAVLARNE